MELPAPLVWWVLAVQPEPLVLSARVELRGLSVFPAPLVQRVSQALTELLVQPALAQLEPPVLQEQMAPLVQQAWLVCLEQRESLACLEQQEQLA